MVFTKILLPSVFLFCTRNQRTTIMNKQTIRIANAIFILTSVTGLLITSMMAWVSPAAVMQLVQTPLPNTDAISSIRGVYGGVGLTLVLITIYLWRKQARTALLLLTMLWSFYALSRLLTIGMEGPLGAFGSRWLGIESALAIIAFVLLAMNKNQTIHHAKDSKY